MSESSDTPTLREKFVRYLSFNLTKRNSLVFILIFTAIVVIDSTIVKFFAYGEVEFPTLSNVAIFVIFSIIYSVSGIMLINSVFKFTSKHLSMFTICP